ncbi:RagB/SusD family nutrient uptake outer membrane protein [Mucilaginibacter lutimaris]|uniref:RagB/SusD family nutrient uptake outer membrane protein n=1 Tax=Mucilaginibacter lutimaris TaxID=931629 RepID=A0ABW2ZLM6_9SPHI
MMKTRHTLYLLTALLMAGCQKDFLDQKPDKALLVPATTADLRALLDNINVFNQSPGLTTLADGDLVATAAGWNNYPNLQERTSYTWSADIFGTESGFDWNRMYQQVFYANIVLDGLSRLDAGPENRELRGRALFYRAWAFYSLAQMFARPYSAATANSDAGIPLKLTPVVTEQAGRGTVAETYAQVLRDLSAARGLLPLEVSYKSHPSREALYGMLSRVCLSMGDYPAAGKYADSCIRLRPTLTDYNTLSTTAQRPFPAALPNGNPEVIFYSGALGYNYSSSSSPTYLAPEFYALFGAADLRKLIFFRQVTPGNYKFKGNYSGSFAYFSGIAADEAYLTRAECAARAGDKAAALADLNALLVKRYKTGQFTAVTAADAESALRLVLLERRKELTMRGTRWTDLRRLNGDARFAVTLTRTLNGETYALAPDSKRYTYPIPPDELKLNSLPQNER